MCWATSHGHLPIPGQPPNGNALAAAGENATDIKSLNIIVTSAQGAFFGTWENARPIVARADTANAREDVFADASSKRYLTALDSQGPKSVPNACLSCHGGRYDPTRKIVVGASLMPLIPAHLHFSSPQARSNAEEQIRRINFIILESNPSPTVSTQITTLYNGTPGTPGTRANDAAVPSGWASQPGLYKQVIAPYCGTCHFSQTGLLHFGTLANLQFNKQRVQKAVCADFTMPHSEQGFRRFWTEGGAVSLPGLLSTVLGYPKCSQ
jgi:mono/diheme cytochrome c family protein